MINIENDVFDYVYERVVEKFPDLHMSGEYVKSPPSFPSSSLVEMDNTTYTGTQTSSDNENHASVMFELNVYSNKKVGKKSECKAIVSFIDEIMISLGFNRKLLQPVPNMDDATIYRMLARYDAVVAKNKTIYRR